MPHTQLRRLEEGTFCPVAWRCVGRMLKASSVVSTVPGDMASWGVLWRFPNSKADAHLPETQSFSCEFFFFPVWDYVPLATSSGKHTLVSSVSRCGDAQLQRANAQSRAGEMAQAVKLLRRTHADLSLKLSTQWKVLFVEMGTCNHSPGKTEMGGSLELAGQSV